MSAERDAPDPVEGLASDVEYYLVSPSPNTKKRHRPDETGDEPDCRTFLHRDDAGWRKLTPRQTVFYDDCTNCFPQRGSAKDD